MMGFLRRSLTHASHVEGGGHLPGDTENYLDATNNSPMILTPSKVIVYDRAWIMDGDKRYSYDYDDVKGSDLYIETGHITNGCVRIHYFEINKEVNDRL